MGIQVRRGVSSLGFLTLVALSCNTSQSGSESCAAGTERCECYRNDTCNDGLTCLSSRCVKYEPEGGSSGTSGNGTSGGASNDNPNETDPSENGGVDSGGRSASNSVAATGGVAQGGSSTSNSVAATGGFAQGGSSMSNSVAATGGFAQGGSSMSNSVAATGGFAQGGASTSNSSCNRGTGGSYVFDDFECGTGQWTPQPITAFSTVLDGTNTFAVTTIINSLSYATIGSVMEVNYRVEAKVKVLSFYTGTGWSFVGLFGNFVSSSTYSAITLWKDGKVAGSVRENGGGSDASNPVDVFVVGQWYTLTLEHANDQTRVYLNGKLISSWLDDNTPAGRIAIGTYNATARFDDVRVTLL